LKDERYEIKVKNHLVRARTNGKDYVSKKDPIILVVQILNALLVKAGIKSSRMIRSSMSVCQTKDQMTLS